LNSQDKGPLVACTLSFACGIYAAGLLQAPFLPACIASLACLAGSFIFRRKHVLFAFCILVQFFLLGISILACSRFCPAHHIQRFNRAFSSASPVILKGRVISTPVTKEKKQQFRIRVETFEDRGYLVPCSGTLFVVAKKYHAVFPGEEVLLRGRLRRPFASAAVPHKRFVVKQKSTAGIITDAVVLKSSSQKMALRALFYRRISALREALQRLLRRDTSAVCAGVLSAMVLGDRGGLPATISNMMIRTGTVHILVVSGFNVGLVCFICMLVLKILRVPRLLRTLGCCCLAVVYCFVTGSSGPVVRATLMAVVFLCGRLFKRDADIGSSCALAALIMLAADPEELFDVGFQLSFSSVFAIIWLYPCLKAFIPPGIYKPPFLKMVLELLLVSLAAWLGTAGLIAWHFGLLTPVAVAANLFVVPLASLLTLCGFSMLITEALLPQAAWIFAPASEFLVHLLLMANNFFLRIPGACIRLWQD